MREKLVTAKHSISNAIHKEHAMRGLLGAQLQLINKQKSSCMPGCCPKFPPANNFDPKAKLKRREERKKRREAPNSSKNSA